MEASGTTAEHNTKCCTAVKCKRGINARIIWRPSINVEDAASWTKRAQPSTISGPIPAIPPRRSPRPPSDERDCPPSPWGIPLPTKGPIITCVVGSFLSIGRWGGRLESASTSCTDAQALVSPRQAPNQELHTRRAVVMPSSARKLPVVQS